MYTYKSEILCYKGLNRLVLEGRFIIPCLYRMSGYFNILLMKKLDFLILILFVLPLSGRTQDTIRPVIDGPINQESEIEVYEAVTLKERPHLSGGYAALKKWCNEHTLYNRAMADSGIVGRIYCVAIIDTLGKIKEPKILPRKTFVSQQLKDETLRLMYTLPDFIPGKYKDRYVTSRDIFVFTYKKDTMEKQEELNLSGYNIIIFPNEK